MKSKRVDQLLVEQGLADSLDKAQKLIRAGLVRVNGHVATKPGNSIPDDATMTVETQEKFVSRGGYKLEAALHHFNLSVQNEICLDVGASTGGFTDCLLQHGAAKVYAIDVGKGQLHWKLCNNPRVIIMDGVNARYLNRYFYGGAHAPPHVRIGAPADVKKDASARAPTQTGASPMVPKQYEDRPTFAVADVSFISLTKVLPAVVSALADSAKLVTLIKPQFEADRDSIEEGGVVRDEKIHQDVIEKIKQFGEQSLGLHWKGYCPSPITGPAGNIEFLALWEKNEKTGRHSEHS